MTERKRVGVLISGRGSNMSALIEACKKPSYPAEIILVISNRSEAAGLDIAAVAGIATRVIDHRKYPSREAFEADLDAALRAAKVDIICMAGFMRLLTKGFVEAWRDRQLNIHPSLLPAFKGLDTHERVIAAGMKISGCTVHFVRTEMDAGPIIAQAKIPVLPEDSPGDLAARVLEAEHKLYPQALKLVASGSARVEGERVIHDRSPD
ncbi:MAG: phosphoribosylglycinamide formyltransferase [Proteobacteria bacterium]|nr:phosphoribosylglycinamide formyltransferase [Pseudomonadota bacterium]